MNNIKYLNSLDNLTDELNNSIIDFRITKSENLNEIVISYPYKNKLSDNMYYIDLQRICFKTNFYRYAYLDDKPNGVDYTLHNDNKDNYPRKIFSFVKNESGEWDGFDDEYSKFKLKMNSLLDNKKNLGL